MVRNILYALGPKQELTPGASITWAFDGRPAVVDLSENGTLTVTGPIADFPMVGLLKVTHTVAGTTLTLSGDVSNVVWSTGAGQHTILEFVWDGTEYVWTSRTKSTTAALTQLSTPGSFAAVASGTNINLSWTDVLNESSYLIEVSDTGTGGWSTLTTPAAGATAYTHEVGTNDTQKFYRIKAVGDGATYSDSAYATANATTQAAAATYLVRDTFSGEADATPITAHTTDSGGTWTRFEGSGTNQSDIVSNKMRGKLDGAAAYSYWTEAGQADVTITCIGNFMNGSIGGHIGIIGRYSDADNHYMFYLGAGGDMKITKKVAGGAYTDLAAQVISWSASTDYTIQVVFSGNNISFTFNGTTLNATDSFNNTATKVGFRTYVATGSELVYIDNYEVQ